MTAKEAAVELVALSKSYKGRGVPVRALREISLTVQKAEHLAVMGPSGSGKSTLLAVIGCLENADGGSYKLFGREVASLCSRDLARIRNEELGFVFQNLSLLSNISVFRNVALPFDYSIIGEAAVNSAVQEALDRVGMLPLANRMPRELSGGQQQRVAIARAIVKNPRLILADEPTGALDQKSAHEIMDAIGSLRDSGRTVITVTHDDAVARRADRVLSFADGRFDS